MITGSMNYFDTGLLKYWNSVELLNYLNRKNNTKKGKKMSGHTNKSATQPWTEGELDDDDFFHLGTLFARSSTTAEQRSNLQTSFIFL